MKMYLTHSRPIVSQKSTVQNYKFLQLTQQQEFKEFIFKHI